MKSRLGSAIVAVGAFAAVSIVAAGANAQQQGGTMTPQGGMVTPGTTNGTVPTVPYRAPVGEQRTEFVRPNMPLLATGGLTLLAAYVPSFIVAASSDHDGDKWLYGPVVGPWGDLASRGCENDIQTATCGTTGWERGALIANGVVQAIGAGMIVGSFFTPSRRLVTTSVVDRPQLLQIAPTTFGSARAPGLVAIGTF